MLATTNTTTLFHRSNLKLFKPFKPFSSSSSNLKVSKLWSSPESPSPPTSLLKRNFSAGDTRLSARQTRTMFELVKASSFRNGDGGEEAVEILDPEALADGSRELRSGILCNRIESTLNKLSKWIVSALFAGVILWRHDGEAVWAAMGSIINAILSMALKRIINQERPVSAQKSDPGMPSSHAQSIFYTVAFAILSIVQELGINDYTVALSGLFLALGSYLTWLRVSQRRHTVSQVIVGAIVGSVFSILWFWSWDAFVLPAFVSSLFVQIVVVLVAAGFCIGFAFYVFKYWLKDD